MSIVAVNSITDASGGNTASINGYSPTESNMAGRNLIINGAMQVAQRGTSGGATAGYVYTLDRWLANGNITSWSQTGSQKDVLQVVTQAGTGIAQRVESNGANFVSGKTYTLSFQVNPSIADVEIGITFRNGNSYLSNVVAVTDVSSQVTAGSYSTVTHTFTLISSADIATYASHNMQVYIGSSVVNTLNITGVQLEAGSVATPFERRPVGTELALCQRYYWRQDALKANGSYYRFCVGVMIASTDAYGVVPFPVEMRAIPSISCPTGGLAAYDGTAVRTGNFIAATDGTNTQSATIGINGISGGTQLRPVHILAAGASNVNISYDAEL